MTNDPLLARFPGADATIETDVCLIVEGCYPHVPGGVSSWVDWLMRSLGHLKFSVVAILADAEPRSPRYRPPSNLMDYREVALHVRGTRMKTTFGKPSFAPPALSAEARALAEALETLIRGGGLAALDAIIDLTRPGGVPMERRQLIESRQAWHTICAMYESMMPYASFLHFYWAWRALFGGLFATLTAPLPRARVYHTISTGYAGLLAARAARETGRPAIVTEHGIYTNERRIEILMAGWIADMVEKGIAIDDGRLDLREIWTKAFESYARCCYDACTTITALYEDNQQLQLALGAAPDKLQVIANGVDVDRFAALSRAGSAQPPTVALIGRVVPIKDVKTFIAAAAIVRERIPLLRALVMGPTDEDKAYVAECRALVDELGLDGCLQFTGSVNLVERLPNVHVVVLTSLSEAQPLVLLEAGAAAIPCVATDVGSCREILEGRSDEVPNLGHGGIVTGLVAPAETADAIHRLLTEVALRERLGDTLHARVTAIYGADRACASYADLYARHGVHPATSLLRAI